jgi:hypothetical protein
MKITKGLTWPFLILSILTTLVFMAGLASLQVGCMVRALGARALLCAAVRVGACLLVVVLHAPPRCCPALQRAPCPARAWPRERRLAPGGAACLC